MTSDLTELARFARDVVQAVVRSADVARVPAPRVERTYGGVFVTLRRGRRLRGCMGTLDVSRPLVEAVRGVATDAAVNDPRFAPLAASELGDLRVELSLLSPPVLADNPLDLELGRHGVLVRSGSRRGLFLPEVALEHHLEREAFLSRCCSEKAGLPPDAWRRAGCQVYFFTTEKAVDPED